MKYRKLGKTGLEVSEIGLGAWQIGGPVKGYFDKLGWIQHGWGAVDDQASISLVKAIKDMGVNFIDTAAVYGNGHSEEVVGKAIAGERDQWIIETKGGEGFTTDNRNWHDFSHAALLRQLDESLRRLQTDYVDVYLLHSPSAAVLEQEECLETLAGIKKAGKARFVGVSTSPGQVIPLLESGKVDVLQVPVSIMSPESVVQQIAAAGEAEVGIVARGAFGAGFFTGEVDEKTSFKEDDRRSWQSAKAKAQGREVAAKFGFLSISGRTLAQSYLKYLLSLPGVSTVITGSKSLQHMAENVGASEAPEFKEDELNQIDQVKGFSQ